MKRPTLAVVLGALLISACRTGAGSRDTRAAANSACAASNGIGRLKLVLTTTSALPETSEALVRLESETERSTVQVNAALGTTFELHPGRYQLSISLAGYNSAERLVSIECGSDRTLTVPLAKKR